MTKSTKNATVGAWQAYQQAAVMEATADVRDLEAELKASELTLKTMSRMAKSLNSTAAGIYEKYQQAAVMEIAANARDLEAELKAAHLTLSMLAEIPRNSCMYFSCLANIVLYPTEIVLTKVNNEILIHEFKNTKLSIYISKNEIRNNKLIACQAEINDNACAIPKATVDCVIACGQLEKLLLIEESQLTSEERRKGKINIVNHFDKLMPGGDRIERNRKGIIGLISFQNGINNTFDVFKKMGEKIIENLQPCQNLPFCIGLYNPSLGFKNDFFNRMSLELRGYISKNVCYTRQMLATFLDLLSTTHHKFLWLHIAHSEAGLIGNLALQNLHKKHQKYVQEHLITATYGAVEPFKKNDVLKAYNTYSKDDIAIFFANKYRLFSGYDIDIVDSLKPQNVPPDVQPFPFPEGDHAFLGETYQMALSRNIKDLSFSGYL